MQLGKRPSIIELTAEARPSELEHGVAKENVIDKSFSKEARYNH